MRGVCESERERERGRGSWDCCWDATDLMSLIAWACRVPLLSERDLQFFRAVKTNLLCDPLVKSVLAVGCMFALQYFTSEQLAQSLNSLYRPVVAVHCLIFCLNSYCSFLKPENCWNDWIYACRDLAYCNEARTKICPALYSFERSRWCVLNQDWAGTRGVSAHHARH